MMVRRFWLDADGGPHVEEATLLPGPVDGEPMVTSPDAEPDGEMIVGPVIVAGLADPAPGTAVLGAPATLYDAELPDGVRIVTRAEWQRATTRAKKKADTARDDVDAQIEAMQSAAPSLTDLLARVTELESALAQKDAG